MPIYMKAVTLLLLSVLASACGDGRLPSEASSPVLPSTPRFVEEYDSCELDPGAPYCEDYLRELYAGAKQLGFTEEQCYDTSAGNADLDAMADWCEYQLAEAFRPRLRFTSGENHSSRESYWAVRGAKGGKAHVVYLLGYHFDPGGGVNQEFGKTWHWGDNEFIILDLVYSPNYGWFVVGGFTSAHWRAGDSSESSAEMNHGFVPHWYDGARGRPYIYVAYRKHANYWTESACDSGGWSEWYTLGWTYDKCDGPFMDQDVEVRSDRNVGSSTAHIRNCTSSDIGPGMECFWEPGLRFAGWYFGVGAYRDPAAGVYRDVLDFFEQRPGA